MQGREGETKSKTYTVRALCVIKLISAGFRNIILISYDCGCNAVFLPVVGVVFHDCYFLHRLNGFHHERDESKLYCDPLIYSPLIFSNPCLVHDSVHLDCQENANNVTYLSYILLH